MGSRKDIWSINNCFAIIRRGSLPEQAKIRVLKGDLADPGSPIESLKENSGSSFYRAMLCIRGTSHVPVSVCLSVCLSVTSRSFTKTAKCRISQTTRDSSFPMPKISTKFDRGHPLRGHQMQVGWVKIGDFRQVTGYISKTVQDRCMVSIKVE